MLRDTGFKPQPKTVNCILMNGGVGDHIASLVAANYILKNYPWIKLLIWVPDFLLEFSKNVLPKKAIVNNYSSMKYKYDPEEITKTTEWDGVISPMKIHCLDYAFLKLCDEIPDIEHMNYLKVNLSKVHLSKFKLPEKYIVITTGYTAAVREFRAESVNKIAKYAKQKGYEIIFLGQTSTKTGSSHTIVGVFDENIDFSIGLNLIDKTSLLEAAKIMSKAKAVIGVDNGLLHVAGCTDVAIVGGFTTVSPDLRMPVRNNELGWNYFPVMPDASLACSYCQSQTNFLYGHDYKTCMYKDNLCTYQMASEKFIKELEKILKGLL